MQDKKRSFLKEACACEEEMREVSEEMEEKKVRFATLSENRETVELQQMIWKKKSRSCRQGRKEEAAVASQFNGGCFDSVMVE